MCVNDLSIHRNNHTFPRKWARESSLVVERHCCGDVGSTISVLVPLHSQASSFPLFKCHAFSSFFSPLCFLSSRPRSFWFSTVLSLPPPPPSPLCIVVTGLGFDGNIVDPGGVRKGGGRHTVWYCCLSGDPKVFSGGNGGCLTRKKQVKSRMDGHTLFQLEVVWGSDWSTYVVRWWV